MKATDGDRMVLRENVFATRGALAGALAEKVAACLAEGLAARGEAVLAISGGSTPTLFFEALSHRAIDWKNVRVTLVDERLVPPSSERSNHGLALRHLLKDEAAAAAFVPLYNAAATPEAAADHAARSIDALPKPFDAVILGMGNDGHTASFFPGGTTLEEASSVDATASVMAIEAPGAGEPRLTLTMPLIAEARFLALHMEGAEKRDVLQKAVDGGIASGLPVARVFAARQKPVEFYWAA